MQCTEPAFERGANGQGLGLTSDAAISIFLIESRRLAGALPTERRCKKCEMGTTWSASHSGPRKINAL